MTDMHVDKPVLPVGFSRELLSHHSNPIFDTRDGGLKSSFKSSTRDKGKLRLKHSALVSFVEEQRQRTISKLLPPLYSFETPHSYCDLISAPTKLVS